MRILITGASGQVGGALLSSLRQHDVFATDRATIDLSQPGSVVGVLDRLRPEIVINAAAFTAVDQAEYQRDLAALVNTQAPSVMASWAAEQGAAFVHFSTDYVFNGQGRAPWREIDFPAPLSVYGWSKLRGDQAVQATGGTHLVVRTSWVYSALGKNFMRTIARYAKKRKELRVVTDQIGAPTSAALVAESLNKMIGERLEKFEERCAQSHGLINLAASGEASWYDFACAIVCGLRKRDVELAVETISPVLTDKYPSPAQRPLNSRLDLTRLKEVFGIVPDRWDARLEPELDLLATEMHSSAERDVA